jgi:hypothetical protein
VVARALFWVLFLIPFIVPKLDPDTHKSKPEDADEDTMDVDHVEVEITPMPSAQGIQALRDKLHAKMDQLRRNRDREPARDQGRTAGRAAEAERSDA